MPFLRVPASGDTGLRQLDCPECKEVTVVMFAAGDLQRLRCANNRNRFLVADVRGVIVPVDLLSRCFSRVSFLALFTVQATCQVLQSALRRVCFIGRPSGLLSPSSSLY
jgi:hypothetical protein